MSANILKGGFNGLSWGSGSSPFPVFLRGFEDLPLVESRDAPKGFRNGSFMGQDLTRDLFVTVSLRIALVNATDADFRAAIDSVNAAFIVRAEADPLDNPLPLQFWNLERYVMARCRDRTWSDIDANWCNHVAQVTARFVVSDGLVVVGTP